MPPRAAALISSCAFAVGVLIPPDARGGVIYHTNFAEGLPNGWSVIDGGQDGVTWTTEDIENRYFAHWTAPFMIVRRRALMDESLVTQRIDCSSYQDVALRFKNCFMPVSSTVAYVDVRVGEEFWWNVCRFRGAEAVGPVEVNLAPIADERPDVQIRWRYYTGSAGYSGYWAIDDIELRSGACLPCSSPGPAD